MRCAAGPAQATHDDECYALQRLAAGDSGLTMAHNDLRLLLRLLSVRRRWMTRVDEEGEGEEEEAAEITPAAEAAAEAGDLIVEGFDAVMDLMSGLDGGDDGELPDDAVATLYEARPYPIIFISWPFHRFVPETK